MYFYVQILLLHFSRFLNAFIARAREGGIQMGQPSIKGDVKPDPDALEAAVKMAAHRQQKLDFILFIMPFKNDELKSKNAKRVEGNTEG